MNAVPESLGIIAGKGVYPYLLAESARQQGVKRIMTLAFKRETDPRMRDVSDEIRWVYVGQLQRMLDAFRECGVKQAVMAGQITPTNLFRVRMDARALRMLRALPARNAHTIFGAIANELSDVGVDLLSASAFMGPHMVDAGVLTDGAPGEAQQADIALGLRVARTSSELEIGQTVVIKEGTVLAVEAFEGTNAAIRRAGKLGGPGAVVVKLAKAGHDMRFDIPVVGVHTLKVLRKIKASTLVVEAGRCIILERDRVIHEANRMGLSLIAVGADGCVS
ncbi:MAG: UDP-2,3-diacylglucosamine diphosphatase LpxI [Kiritimatiellae bacterium]|nr:UDP-2,3-diacylglucosamine diphosphatase LpxI [Kiritimatiellia bacterium]